MTESRDCDVCNSSVIELGTSGWNVGIPAGRAPLLGWVTISPGRHVASPDELTFTEAGTLGGCIAAVSAVLREKLSVPRIYVANWAEECRHVHFHLIPRPAILAERLRGAGIFSMMSVPQSDRPSVDAQHRLLKEIATDYR